MRDTSARELPDPDSDSRIAVRSATENDIDFLITANAAMALETEGLALDPTCLRAGVGAALGDRGRGTYVIAEVAGRAVGCLLITREWSDWRNGWVWWIQSVFVAPYTRGRGVYHELHSEVLRRAREAGDVVGLRLYVDRNNLRARSVYEREGMHASHYVMFEGLDPLRG